jgi:hypothetical protein
MPRKKIPTGEKMDLYTIATQEDLERISRHCPEALCTYLQCINRADENGSLWVSKVTVENDMSYGWAKFKNNIKKLALENLLEWHFFTGGISITLAALDENE